MAQPRSPINRLNDRLGLTLAVFVPVSAIPLASNRASWWLLWTAALAVLAAWHFNRSVALEPRQRPRVLRFRLAFALGALVPVWALVQMLPFGSVLPAAFVGMRDGLSDLAGASISVLPDVALGGILRFVGYLFLLALVIEAASRGKRVLRIATVVFFGIAFHALWAIVSLRILNDFSLWGPKIAYQGVATGTFINRNSLATFLGFGMVLGVGLLVERSGRNQMRTSRPQRWLEKVGYTGGVIILGMLVQVVALLATESRLGLVSTVAGLVTVLLVHRWRNGVSPLRVIAEGAGLLLVVILGVAVIAGGEGVMERFIYSNPEGTYRLALYKQTLGMIATRPLGGFGMDSFGFAFEAFRAPPLLGQGTFDLSHNSYLMLWSEFGVVIGSIPPLLLLAAAVILWRRMADPNGFPGIALAGIGVLAIGGVHSLGDFSLEIPANVYLFLTVIGLGLGWRSRKTTISTSAATAEQLAILSARNADAKARPTVTLYMSPRVKAKPGEWNKKPGVPCNVPEKAE